MHKCMRPLGISTMTLVCTLFVVAAVIPAALAQGRAGWRPPPARGDPSVQFQAQADPSTELQAQIDELAQRLSVLEAGSQPDTITVNCLRGETVADALEQVADTTGQVTIIVLWICNENVTIRRDNLTLQGARGGGLRGPDPARATIFIDAARRVVIDNLSISGGSDGVIGNRGAIFDLLNCTVASARFGVVATNGGTAVVDNCDIGNNGENGVVAANSAQLYLTNSIVHDNGDSGVVAVRNAHIRVGQDLFASVLGPVTIRDNEGSGLVVTENSAGILVASTVENNTGSGVFVGRGSNAQIGVGSLGAVGPNTIRFNGTHGVSVFQSSQALIRGNTIQNHPSGNGIFVEGAAATIIGNEIRNSGSSGIRVQNAGSARIGITDRFQRSGNTIELNTLDGVTVSSASAAFMSDNTVQTNGRYGLGVFRAEMRLMGLNTIQGNGVDGVIVVQGTLFQGKGDSPFTNDHDTIQNNSNGSGIVAFNNATLDIQDATISGNAQNGVGLFIHSTLRITGSSTAISGHTAGAGILVNRDSAVRFDNPPVTVTGNDSGVLCTDGESSFGTRQAGAAGGVTGNVSVNINCTGF